MIDNAEEVIKLAAQVQRAARRDFGSDNPRVDSFITYLATALRTGKLFCPWCEQDWSVSQYENHACPWRS